VIRRQPDGEFIYGARLRGQEVVKMTLEGRVVLTIPASAVPDEVKIRNARSGQLSVSFTGVEVGPAERSGIHLTFASTEAPTDRIPNGMVAGGQVSRLRKNIVK
jgi:hypothetical protein